VAEEQRRWGQALDYYLKALSVFVEFNDKFNTGRNPSFPEAAL
jgi:hypothetical protein